jgi:nuclease S1
MAATRNAAATRGGVGRVLTRRLRACARLSAVKFIALLRMSALSFPSRLCCCLLALSAATTAQAWGERGHRLVGALAERELSPAALAQVRELLAGEPDPTLAGVSVWADEMRETNPWSAPLHYVRIRDRSCRFDAARDCTDGGCVVGAIDRYARQLADRRAPDVQRRHALKFLVHFVADVHQPLHSGYRPDKGGNAFQISMRRPASQPQGTNLHAVWDYFMLAQTDEPLALHAERLQAQGAIDAGAPFVPAEATHWAETSCRLTDREGFYPRRPGRLPAGYLERFRPLAEQRVREAAAELTLLLEGALAAP